MPHTPDQPVLIDVSRLIWRVWAGRLPTGIDRVCLAYVEHFGPRARAVVQRKGRFAVLTPADSQRLFALLAEGGPRFRRRLLALACGALPRALLGTPPSGALYLNIGHTGLDSADLPRWIARHDLRAVYLIHDLIPIRTPEFCRPGEAEKHGRRMVNALTSATGIIANSAATLDDLHAFATSRSLACPKGIAAWLAGDALPADVAPASTAHPYFVTIGTIEGRKNHILLLQLWQRLVAEMGAQAPHLVIVGQRGWEAAGALAILDRCRELDDVVRELGRCDDAELAELVKSARALLMPSFAEGFGMPVIEALQLGTPVIASDLAVFREIAADIPTYLPPFDAVGWERTIRAFCEPSPERERQIAAMQGYRGPDWPCHFAEVEAYLATLPGAARKG